MGGQYSHSVAKDQVLETMHADGMLHFIQNENKRWTEILNNMEKNSSILPSSYVKMEMEETLFHWYNLIHTSKETAQLYDHGGQQKHFQGGQSLQKENEHLKRQVFQLRQQLDSERSRTQQGGSYKLVPTTEIKDKEIASLKVQIRQLETNIEQLEQEQEQLILRLSKFVGDQLYKNNPDIADLSDQNRPTKLGEMYSELYDNQWTDAYEALLKAGHSDNEALETLKLTLMSVFSFCEKKAGLLVHRASGAVDLLFEEYKTTVESMNMKKPPSHPTVVRKNVDQDFQNILLQLRWMPNKNEWEASMYDQTMTMSKQKTKEEIARVKSVAEDKLVVLRKEVALSMVPLVQQAYIEASWNDECIPKMKPYIRQCLFISWMMVVQSPPMLLHVIDDGAKFDKNYFKPYTASGPKVEYIVWPAMLLHKGGPVVSKGVAQGMREETLHGRCSPIPKDE